MSSIVLSSSVRQNLLSLQSTASLLATTQNDLSTGNKVNSALDNPTNYFTAQSLNNRASDIGNLLDGIGNGVQVLQAANTGLTSLQSLVASAQSIATQALQTPIGYSTKSNVATTIAGATATNLLGTTSFTNAVSSSNILYSGAAGGTTAAVAGKLVGGISGSISFAALSNNNTTPVAISGSTVLAATTGAASNALSGTDALLVGKSLTVNGHTITFSATAAPATTGVAAGSGLVGSVLTDGSGNSTIYLGTSATSSTATIADVENAIDLASGVQTTTNTSGTAVLATSANSTNSGVSAAGELKISSSAGGTTTIVGSNDVLNAFGLTNAVGSTNGTVTVSSATSAATTANLIQAGSTLNVEGKTITFASGAVPSTSSVALGSGVNGNIVTDGNGNSTVYLQGATLTDTLNAIDIATGAQTATITAGHAALTTGTGQTPSSVATNGSLQISTGTNADLAITGTGNALSALGLGGNQGTATAFNAARTASASTISGKTLTFSAFNGGTAVNVTFGNGTNGTVQTLADLNTALQSDNLNATLDAKGNLTISASNDFASSTLGSAAAGGAIGGTLTSALTFSAAAAPVADATAQATRAGLVSQYNNILAQINSTAQDSSFNGVNLLNGDQLKLVFDETGKSTLNISGVTFNSAGLGLTNLVSGTDFIDNNATNSVLTNLTSASNSLRSEASSLGSNLSIVQIRQDFSKNLINVLQTGSSNLTLADTNGLAADSQALSTRQSIAVSALALANTSQQSVLQLLR
jgi:flagellin